MPRREFTSQKALQAHAEQTGNVCVLEGIAIRQQQLSPDQYEIVDVRTSHVPWSAAVGPADPQGGLESPDARG
jgi:hypothetical protein